MDLQELISAYLVYYPVGWLHAGDIAGARRRLEKLEREPRELRDARKLVALRKLVDHARGTVPHWREAGLPAGADLRALTDVARLPFTEKAAIQEHPQAFLSTAKLGRLVPKTSAGSTGAPLTIWKTRPAMTLELAATWRAYGWAGIRVGDRRGLFWGVPHGAKAQRRARMIDAVCNRRRVSAFRLDAASLDQALAGMRRFRPRWLYGYTTVLCEFAEHLRRRGEAPGFKVACIVSTAELLTKARRRLLEEVFATRVYDEYGCGEVGSIAHECEAGRLHICDENMLVEVIADGRPCKPGETGEIVVTELNNYAMPLIRYRLSDFGLLAAAPCSCGRTLGVIENIYGRVMDVLVDRRGRRFHGERVTYLVEEAAARGLDVRQFQCAQEAVDHFRIRLVPGNADVGAVERYLESRFKEEIDPEARFEFEVVEAIARTPSGKQRVIMGLETPAARLAGGEQD
jgi:phenylacetate-CoA ligase